MVIFNEVVMGTLYHIDNAKQKLPHQNLKLRLGKHWEIVVILYFTVTAIDQKLKQLEKKSLT